MLLAVSDTVWTALIGGTFALATAVVGAFVAIRTTAAKANNAATDAKVTEVSARMDPLVELADGHRQDAIAARAEAKVAAEEARVARVEAREEHAAAVAFEQKAASQEIELRYLREELRRLRGSMGQTVAHDEAGPEDPVPD